MDQGKVKNKQNAVENALKRLAAKPQERIGQRNFTCAKSSDYIGVPTRVLSDVSQDFNYYVTWLCKVTAQNWFYFSNRLIFECAQLKSKKN